MIAAVERRLCAAGLALGENHSKAFALKEPNPGKPRLRKEEIDQTSGVVVDGLGFRAAVVLSRVQLPSMIGPPGRETTPVPGGANTRRATRTRTGSRGRRRIVQRAPLFRPENSRRGGVVDARHFRFVGGEAAVEVLDESEDVPDARTLAHLREEVARQLAHLDPLQVQFPLRIASRDSDSKNRWQEGLLFARGPKQEASMEVGEGQAVRFLVSPIESTAKVVEAASQCTLSGKQSVEGSIRKLARLG